MSCADCPRKTVRNVGKFMEAIATLNRLMGHKSNQAKWARELSRLCGRVLGPVPMKRVHRADSYSSEFTFREHGCTWRDIHVFAIVDAWESRDAVNVRIASYVEAPWGQEHGDSVAFDVRDERELRDPETLMRHTSPFASTIAMRRDPEQWLRSKAAAFVRDEIATIESDLAALRAWVTDSGTVDITAALQKVASSSNRERVRAASDWLDRVRKAGQRVNVGLAG